MKEDKISVCMTTYNGENHIVEQLESILRQLKDTDEVIISDDGSTDKTIDLINGFNDIRIKLYLNSFRNIVLNFEFALSKATGNIIFLSDQDDIWYDNKVAEITEILGNYDLVYTNASVFSDRKEINTLFNQKKRNGYMRNYIKNYCLGATMAFKSHILKRSLPFPRKIEMHDMWIYFIGSIYGKTYYYKKPLIYYRRHGFNASNSSDKTTNSFFKIIKIRYVLLINLIKRVFHPSGQFLPNNK